jgi:Ni2+-binding GTPase involved in maturation of urease and hydrogenase
LIDKDVRDSKVYLARNEQEFKQLCQHYPKSNVHWLEKHKSGYLVWKQSQGSLETLREYIDTERSHTYTADDLDMLLEQAVHHRVMLISDTAGMGKSTVLTHLSKQIKQKFPTKWVVRIDLSDHTDALEALKKEQIRGEKAIEFVSEKLLKLKPGLEVELFKQCCEQEQKIRVIIMLDGFDKISPYYKDTVIDLLQALRQAAVEQLWVATRPHLRAELEEKLQQLSYTLEPFSEENQVEFLTKFWCLKDWFIESENKDEEKEKSKLEIYAENLIKNLAYSISDKDEDFTGIPLHTRMLAEAFDKEVKTFYQSAESMPELPMKLDLLGIYERFIERKYDIYQEEKLQISLNNVAAMALREHHLKTLREDHQLLALKVLLTEEQVAQLETKRHCSYSDEELSRIGIVQVNHDGKLHFIHRTFAEYLVADYLVNRVTEGKNTSEQVVAFIMEDLFLGRENPVIRVFVDGLISRSELSEEALTQ